MPNVTKPPIGVAPHWFIYRNRMQELTEAIARQMEHIQDNHDLQSLARHYTIIAQWAKELEALARLEIELEAQP